MGSLDCGLHCQLASITTPGANGSTGEIQALLAHREAGVQDGGAHGPGFC